MAELSTKSFQREDTPVYNQKAAVKEFPTIDQTVGSDHFAEAKLFQQGMKFTENVGKIVNAIDLNRQDAILEKMDDAIISKSIENEQLIGDLNKYESSQLDPNKILNDYNSNGIKVDGGTIKLPSIEQMDGYESLNTANQRKIREVWQEANRLTTKNIFKEITALSRSHKVKSLEKSGLKVANTVSMLMIDKNNWNQTKGVAPYIMQLSEHAGLTPGMKEYREYWTDQALRGNKDIPGAPKGGFKMEHLGVSGGMKVEAKKQVDKILDEYQKELFSALEKTNIEFSDVDKMFHKTMQTILYDQFLGEYNAFSEQAIRRASSEGYTYKRNFDNKYMKGEIEYVLDPALTKKHILDFNAKAEKAKDLSYVNRLKESLSKDLANPDFRPDPLKYSTKQQWHNNPQLTPGDVGELQNMIFKSNLSRDKADDEIGKALMLDELEQIVTNNNKDLDLISYVDKKTGVLIPKEINDILKIMPDREETHSEWIWKGKTGKGELIDRVTTVNATERNGAKTISKSDISNLLVKMNKNGQAELEATYTQVYKSNQKTPLGRKEIFLDFAEFNVAGKPTRKLSESKLSDLYNSNKAISKMIRKTYPSEIKFRGFAEELLRTTFDIEETELKKTRLDAKYIQDSEENLRALSNAIKQDHGYELQRWLNIANGIETLDGKPTSEENKHRVTPKGGTNVDKLLTTMKEKHGTDVEWGNEAKGMLSSYEKSMMELYNISAGYKLLNMNDLGERIGDLQSGSNTRYYLTNKLSTHVKQNLELRLHILKDKPDIARVMIEKELMTGSSWHEYLGIGRNAAPLDILKKVSRYLGYNYDQGLELQPATNGDHSAILKYKALHGIRELQTEDTSIEGRMNTLVNTLGMIPSTVFE